MQTKIMVTGSTGYIGHEVALAAANAGYMVHVLSRSVSSPYNPVHPGIEHFYGDINDKQSVGAAMAGCDSVIHCAGLTRLYAKDSEQFYRVNVEGTRTLLERAFHFGIRRFVFTSSCAVAGPSLLHPLTEDDPRITPLENDYEISKYMAEKLVREYNRNGLETIILSPSRVYGVGLNTPGNPITQMVTRVLKRRWAVMPKVKMV